MNDAVRSDSAATDDSGAMHIRRFLLGGTALLTISATAAAQESQPVQAETTPPADASAAEPQLYDDEDSDTIVVTGARSSVIGNIPPENTLTTRDIAATGAADMEELLDAIAPQIGSASGRGGERPITLLNGQRISSFRELRDIPTEAIARVEILPEEVALRYGYRADQKVVNIVLRPRFRSTTARVEASTATDLGHAGAEGDLTRLMIGENSRTTIDLDAELNSALTEAERDVLLEDPTDDIAVQEARTLIGSRRQLQGTLTHNRMLGAVSATGNVELEHVGGRSLIGLGETLLLPLARNTTRNSAHGGFVLNGNVSDWRWSVTGNADLARSLTKTERDSPIGLDRAESTTASGDLDAMTNGTFLALPAGDAGATMRVGVSTVHLDTDRSRRGIELSNSLGRTVGTVAANLDLPISRRDSQFAGLGNLTLNGNAGLRHFSDFGTLTVLGAGANLSPVKRLNLIASWTREEGAPTIQQLGEPVIDTPDTRIFDFTTGETVLVTAITGGNPNLDADSRNVWKLGGNWKPLTETDLTIRGEYVSSRIKDPIANFPGPTATLEAAFPERFLRNSAGELVSVDLRPVNYESARRDTLRVGFDFSKPLKSAGPSQAAIAAFRARRQSSDGQAQAATSPGESAREDRPRGGRGGGRGFGRFGGDSNRGRLTFSITDTITFVDEVTIRDDLKLDYLGGDAAGQFGGTPRHRVEARAGYFNNGIGARLSANWRSGTEVRTTTGDDLRFSPLGTVDLRLWANLGQQFDLVAKHPWLRGSSLRFEVNNIFDSKPKVRDASGDVPFGYQPDLLDPLGRTISISFRKLFLPPRGAFRRGGADD